MQSNKPTRETHEHLKSVVFQVIEGHAENPIELEEVIGMTKAKLNGNAHIISEKDIVLAVHDLLDYQKIKLTSDRRLRANGQH